MAKMDVRLIMQVIINIVNNAVKYTPAGTEITLSAVKKGKMVSVSISDTGTGIDDDTKSICLICSIRQAAVKAMTDVVSAWD